MNYEDRVTKQYIENALGSCAKIAVGMYTGTGLESQNVIVDVGFYPKAVLLSEAGGNKVQAMITRDQAPWTGGAPTAITMFYFRDTGFEVAGTYAGMNTNSKKDYYYIAIG